MAAPESGDCWTRGTNGTSTLPSASREVNLLLNLCVLVAGSALWKALRVVGIAGPPRSRRGDEASLFREGPELRSTVARNYTCFLKHCRDMFLALTFFSAAFTIPHWGPEVMGLHLITLGDLYQEELTTVTDLDALGLVILCCDTFLRGLVALAFVERLQRKVCCHSHPEERIQRTLWLAGLPVYDRETRQDFWFSKDDFELVASDLRRSINKELMEHELDRDPDMEVSVAPVMRSWHDACLSFRSAQERLHVYLALSRAGRGSCWGGLRRAWYRLRHRWCEREVARLRAEVDRIESGPKRISGTAFITFTDRYPTKDPTFSDRDPARHPIGHFLRDTPHCWECRDHTYFSFGRPPFRSVTLTCKRAPHPADVNWMNLHVTWHQQLGRSVVCVVPLLFVMMGLVIPTVAIPFIQQRLHTEALTWLSGHLGGPSFAQQLPAVLLLVINSLLLPYCIYLISIFVNAHRYSSVEVIQLHLNATFLLLNSVVIPCLDIQTLHPLFDCALSTNGKHVSPALLVEIIGKKLMGMPGIFALRYILNSACLTNTNSLLQIPQLAYRACARRSAKTARESVEAEEAWVFAWGYWYAWNISIFAIGIIMSSVVPSTLPCAALFFVVQHRVDVYNLSHRIYASGPDIETENLLATRVLHYMRCIIAAWWFLTGWGFMFFIFKSPKHDELAQTWDEHVPHVSLEWVKVASLLLIVLAVMLALLSWWTHQSILHDGHFRNVKIGERGCGCISKMDQFARSSCCMPLHMTRKNYRALGSKERPERADSVITDCSNVMETDTELEYFQEETRLTWDAETVIIKPLRENSECSGL